MQTRGRAAVDEDVLSDFADTGMPEELQARLRGRGKAAAFRVWDVNRPVLEVFLGCATQWRTEIMTTMKECRRRFLGLDYSALEVVARSHGLDLTPAVLRDIQAMEAAAARVLNEA